tara:strand:+ start:92 stop:355 length:264 start_codon:yes stop_codon:yes gene_type:complete
MEEEYNEAEEEQNPSDDTRAGNKSETSELLRDQRERIEELETEKLEREKELAEDQIGGKTEAGKAQEVKPKEETPKEYGEKVLSGNL